MRVEQQVGGEEYDGKASRDGRHAYAEGQLGIEQAAPPVRIRTARTGRHDEQSDAHGVGKAVVPQREDGEVSEERHEDELHHHPRYDGPPVVELVAQVLHVDRGRHTKDEEEEEEVGCYFGHRVERARHAVVVAAASFGDILQGAAALLPEG